jgi:transglutaminase-like putative cysteine protease
MSGLVEAVKRANAPKPPEPSVRLRIAASAAIAVGLLAAASEHEIALGTSLVSIALVGAGMVFSYRNRERSLGWVKVVVAISALAAMAWFVQRLSGRPVGDITSVENPLTVLFAWILIVHSFHVPARRDLVFALAGSAALMAVAAAQAVDMGFGIFALAWVACGLWALLELGAAAGGGGIPLRVAPAAGAGIGVLVTGLVAFLLLPAPTVAARLDFRSAASAAGPVPGSGLLAGDSGSPVELSHPGTTSGRTRVGGYLGFAGDLDTAARGQLGKTVVMEVRASVPSLWVGETYDQWTGQSWTATTTRSTSLQGGSPFVLPAAPGLPQGAGEDDLQTFYVKDATANLVFHADVAQQLWFPSSKVYFQGDGSIISPIGLGKGAIYTVDSSVSRPSAGQLQAAGHPDPQAQYTQLPKPYADVHQLALSITSGDTNEYDIIQSLIAWIGANTHYSTDIPPLPAGGDSVEEFLFGNRTGFCEQISTSLAVMLRSLGIPTREAVGYVPGPYNPITDLYEVRAEDAHAWVQAYFNGYGWVSFDPTAVVPDANPSPGGTALRIAGRFVAGLPWVPISVPLAAAGAAAAAVAVERRWRVLRRRAPAERAVLRMERAGRKAGRPRRASETVTEYGRALQGGWPEVARAAEAAAYGGVDVADREWQELLRSAELGRERRAEAVQQ